MIDGNGFPADAIKQRCERVVRLAQQTKKLKLYWNAETEWYDALHAVEEAPANSEQKKKDCSERTRPRSSSRRAQTLASFPLITTRAFRFSYLQPGGFRESSRRSERSADLRSLVDNIRTPEGCQPS
jgi:hypothetical protein